MKGCNDYTRKGCKYGACRDMDRFEQKAIPYEYVGTCPKCGTYNEAWEKREKTVERDVVYCWHCGCKVQLK